jgi:hypothetical protein
MPDRLLQLGDDSLVFGGSNPFRVGMTDVPDLVAEGAVLPNLVGMDVAHVPAAFDIPLAGVEKKLVSNNVLAYLAEVVEDCGGYEDVLIDS